jgi:hypothetical protein
VFNLPDEASRKIVLNRVADLSSAVFGEMCLLKSDELQALLELTAAYVQTSTITTAQIFKLQEQAAPQNSQFVRGMVYWMAIGDHVFFVKTQSMTAEYLRQYLDWLLKVSSTLAPNIEVKLQAEFDRSQIGGDIGEIQSLRVRGAAVPYSVRAAANAPVNLDAGLTAKVKKTARRILDKVAMMEQAVPVLEALIGKPRTQSLVESLGPNEYPSGRCISEGSRQPDGRVTRANGGSRQRDCRRHGWRGFGRGQRWTSIGPGRDPEDPDAVHLAA